jgi:flagellar biosynthesis protein
LAGIVLSVTQKPGPDRSLAIALENVTSEALARPGERPGGEPGSDAGAAPRGAPRVVASGRGAVAEQILQIAFERGVKVRSDSDLAEILAAVEVDSEIPLAALAGVAEILRYLYRTDSAGAAGTAPAAKADTIVPGSVPDREEE